MSESRYNRYTAVRYALSHALNYNRWFHHYSERGDCTNFVSQALWAGGWPMYLLNFSKFESWAADPYENARSNVSGWKFKQGCTAPWAAAEAFQRFARVSGRCTLSNRFQVTLGDVAQIVDINGTPEGGRAHHTMLITSVAPPSKGGGIGGANLWFTYHSKDKINVPLAQIEANLLPQQQLIFWKVADIIPPIPKNAIPFGEDLSPWARI